VVGLPLNHDPINEVASRRGSDLPCPVSAAVQCEGRQAGPQSFGLAPVPFPFSSGSIAALNCSAVKGSRMIGTPGGSFASISGVERPMLAR
jgi:hypothetical protein